MKKLTLSRLLTKCSDNVANSEIAIIHLINNFEDGRICAAAARRAFRGGLWSAFVIDAKRYNTILSAWAAVEPEKTKGLHIIDLAECSAKYFDYFVY